MWRPTWISNKKLFPHIIHLSYSMVRYYSTIYDSYGTHNVTKWQSILRRSIKSFVPYKLYSRVQIYSYRIHVNEYWFPFAVQSLSEELNHQHLKLVTKIFYLQQLSPTLIANILWDVRSSEFFWKQKIIFHLRNFRAATKINWNDSSYQRLCFIVLILCFDAIRSIEK